VRTRSVLRRRFHTDGRRDCVSLRNFATTGEAEAWRSGGDAATVERIEARGKENQGTASLVLPPSAFR
jgi:hypothetical protein